MLHVDNLRVSYGAAVAVDGATIEVRGQELVAVVGRNGAGKTTLLMAISGLLRPGVGTIEYNGARLDRLPAHRIVQAGVAQVPQGRYLFGGMTVTENLEVGTPRGTPRGVLKERLDEVYDIFPILYERRVARARNLSGGQQQMVAIARALMSSPEVLLLDEPSTGLAPVVVDALGDTILALREKGLAILLVEQNAALALDLADRAYVMVGGRVAEGGRAADLKHGDVVRKAYLGDLAGGPN